MLICVDMVSWLSNHVPRFLTADPGEITSVPTSIPSMLKLAGYGLVPMRRNSVFPSFNMRLLEIIQDLIADRHSDIACRAASSFAIELG